MLTHMQQEFFVITEENEYLNEQKKPPTGSVFMDEWSPQE